MANLFKTRYLINADGTESTTALTNANTVFVHTYLGDDNTGDGTREKPYRSVAKANLKSGVTYILFRGLINEYFVILKHIAGDDINQVIMAPAASTLLSLSTATVGENIKVTENHYMDMVLLNKEAITGINIYGSTIRYSLIKNLTVGNFPNISGLLQNTIINNYNSSATIALPKNRYNQITVKLLVFATNYDYHLFLGTCVYRNGLVNIIVPLFTNDSAYNLQLMRNAAICAGSSFAANKDLFGNETCRIIKEIRSGGTHVPIFNKYAPDLTGTLNAAITIGAKTSITLNVADSSVWPTTGDIFMATETDYTANGITMPAGSFEVWTYTSVTIVSSTRITLNGISYVFKTAHNNLTKECKRYGDVLDFTLNPDNTNEALWASDTGGYVGCFRPAVDGILNQETSIIDVNEDGTDTVTAGTLMQIDSSDNLSFNSSSLQLWNRLRDVLTIEIALGSNFKGLNAMSDDGSPFGFYIGKKQNLIDATVINVGEALTVGKLYKIYNDVSQDITMSILYNGVQYLPEYTFICVAGVTTFTLLNEGTGTYVKRVNASVLESIEILPYDNMTTPSAFPRFSAPLLGECKLLYYTAAGAARYTTTEYPKTAGTPVIFSHLAEANFVTDFPGCNEKGSMYDSFAISNADQEFLTLGNPLLTNPKSTYFTTAIPTLRFLKREINGHFDRPYDY